MSEFVLHVLAFFVIALVVIGGSTAIVFRRELGDAWREFRTGRARANEKEPA